MAAAADIATAMPEGPVERWECPHCPRDDFKSAHALNIHIGRSHKAEKTPEAAFALPAAPASPPAAPASPPPVELYAAERFACGRCGSSAFASSVGDPTICVRCDIARRTLARQDAAPFVCRDCRRDTVAPSPSNPAVCVQCARRAQAAAD